MWNLPDVAWLIYWGIFGVIVAALGGCIVSLWAFYHVYMALSAYIGG